VETFFTFEEVSDLLKVSRQTIDKYTKKGLYGVLLESSSRGIDGVVVRRQVSLEQLLHFCARTKYKNIGLALAARESRQDLTHKTASIDPGDGESHLLSLAFERSSRIAAESQLAVAQAELSRLHLDVARLNGEVARLRRAMQVLVEEEAHPN
jgi:hypothetical protein